MNDYRTKKISLPSGQMIEIIYLIDPDAPVTSADVDLNAATHEIELPLNCCPNCVSDLVFPLTWQDRDDGTWTIERRCPNCEWSEVGSFDQNAVEAYDDILESATEVLLMELRTWSYSNMNDDVERLISAINADLIQPIDF